jgi:hypothetical protein
LCRKGMRCEFAARSDSLERRDVVVRGDHRPPVAGRNAADEPDGAFESLTIHNQDDGDNAGRHGRGEGRDNECRGDLLQGDLPVLAAFHPHVEGRGIILGGLDVRHDQSSPECGEDRQGVYRHRRAVGTTRLERRRCSLRASFCTEAVKIHKNIESFNKELAAYQRLYDHRVQSFMGFAIPTLMTYSSKLQVLEISIVKPPCMLDFAAATVDKPNDFSDEAMEIWWADVADAFGDDFGVAADVFWAMKEEHGIFYWDLKPRNLQFR